MGSPYVPTTIPLDLGPLGHITALALSPKGTSHPHAHYIGGLPYALPPTGAHRFRPPRHLPNGYTYGTRANPGSFTGKTGLCPQPGYRQPPDETFWTEDCLQLNIWIPAGKRPDNGWPVFFYCHGGWLQFGTANMAPETIARLIGETHFKAVVVMPSYRLNLFGFLAGRELDEEAAQRGETTGNMGFWDQRCALEWTSRNIGRFGGDREKITVAGYSAGSHSTFQQLAHDLDRPKEEQIIRRVIMWSNGPGVQAKRLGEHQDQFDELLGRLGIPLDLKGKEKLKRLREVSVGALVAVQDKMQISEFRALSDGVFVGQRITEEINNGTFARKLKERGIRILNGECAEEWNVYGSWRTPSDSYDSVYQRLVADYPESTVKKLMPIYFPEKRLTKEYKDWPDAFGKVYADMQVYALERGFVDRLASNGLTIGKDLLRYRIEWRAKCVDAFLPPEWGVTHSSDMAIWFHGNGWANGLTDKEKEIVQPLNKVLADFVGFEDIQWPEKGKNHILRLGIDGKTEMWEDDRWDQGVEVWNVVNGGTEMIRSNL